MTQRLSLVSMLAVLITRSTIMAGSILTLNYIVPLENRLAKLWFGRGRHRLNLGRCFLSQTLSVEYILDVGTREKCIARLKSMPPLRVGKEVPPKKAAVLVPLCIVNNEVSFLYTLRSSELKSYRGHVSFPGGVKDDSDRNLEETAIRETEEELGINKSSIDIWGPSNFIGTARMDMLVMPYLGCLGVLNLDQLRLSPEEVESVFTVPLSHLCNPTNQRYTHFRGKYSLPVFTGAEHKIWGVTAVITHVMLTALLPSIYKNKLKILKFGMKA